MVDDEGVVGGGRLDRVRRPAPEQEQRRDPETSKAGLTSAIPEGSVAQHRSLLIDRRPRTRRAGRKPR
jgi:hypothetical protein